MNKRIHKAVVLALIGGGAASVATGVQALDKTGAISTAGPTYVNGNAPNFAWDGHNAKRDTPTVFGGTSKNLGWAHNSKWFDLEIKEAGSYTVRLIRTNPDHSGFNPAFSLWPIGALPFDFDNCKGACGDTVDFHGTHSYNQISPPSKINASAWMLALSAEEGKAPSGKTTFGWTPKPGTGSVTGFIGYVNSGPTGWENGMPINADSASNNFNLSQDRITPPTLVQTGFINKAVGGGLGGSTLDAKANICVPKGGGVAAMNLYGAAAGHYLIALGGSCNVEVSSACYSADGSYLLEIVKLDKDGPQAIASTQTPKARALSKIVLNGSESFDPINCDLDYEWSQTDTSGIAIALSDKTKSQPNFTVPASAIGKTLAFSLKVKSAGGTTATSQDVAVTVTNDNDAPTIKITTPQPGTEQTLYTLNSSATDPNGDGIASYKWEQTAGPTVVLEKDNDKSLTFMAPNVSTGSATLSFKLSVTDDYSPNPKSGTATVDVEIIDDPTLLDCSGAKASNESLWPANKTFKTVSIAGVAGPNPYSLAITGVTSDEPVKDKKAKDTTGPDAKIKKGKVTKKALKAMDTVQLRAERQAKGNGRVYAVNFQATDGVQTCTGAVKVESPTSAGMNAADDGQMYDATKPK